MKSLPTFVSDVEWEEHDKTYGVKKVSSYVDNGDGTVVRLSKGTVLAPYSINDVDKPGTDINYYGFEDEIGRWYILKEDKTSNPNSYRYAAGASDYATAWTGRAGQSYNTFNATF